MEMIGNLVEKKVQVEYSQNEDLRWSGINSYICPQIPPAARAPKYMDCSSFVTWVYWTAFGKGIDYLNGESWKAGYTGTMAQNGELVSIQDALPGDLVFYGTGTFCHVTIYAGASMVYSYGSDGPVKFHPINPDKLNFGYCDGTVRFHAEIRRYPEFFSETPPPPPPLCAECDFDDGEEGDRTVIVPELCVYEAPSTESTVVLCLLECTLFFCICHRSDHSRVSWLFSTKFQIALLCRCNGLVDRRKKIEYCGQVLLC